jgi:hypothetical protein
MAYTEPHAAGRGDPEPAAHWRAIMKGPVGWSIAVALTFVIVSPIALSSSDLMRWARSPLGLGLDDPWPWVVFLALDAAAAVCVGMVILAALVGERATSFHLLVWIFAGGSALANYRQSGRTPAEDDQAFFPAMSLLGPLLLEIVLAFFRRLIKLDAGRKLRSLSARDFGAARWMPGVSFRETLAAWRVAKREGITDPHQAIILVREIAALRQLSPVDALRLAWSALGSHDVHIARTWLAARGVVIDQATIDTALAELPELAPMVQATVTLPLTPAAGIPVLPAEVTATQAPAPPNPSAPAPTEPAATEPAPEPEPASEPTPESSAAAPTVEPATEPETAPSSPADVPSSAPSSARPARPAPPTPAAGLPATADPEADVARMGKRAAYRHALAVLGIDRPTGEVIAWLTERGVQVDTSDFHKVRRAAERAAVEAAERAGEPRRLTALPGGGR